MHPLAALGSGDSEPCLVFRRSSNDIHPTRGPGAQPESIIKEYQI